MDFELKHNHKQSRHKRVRAKISGTAKRPRVSVYKSNQHLFVQFINDEDGKTLISNKILESVNSKAKTNKIQKAETMGETLAKQAVEAGIKEIVFDRGGFKYHGRVKALAEGLRKGGMKF